MSGLARQMPWTMAAFAVASLSLVGIPPASGFVSKWYLAVGSVERGNLWLLAVLLLSSLLSAAYLGPIVYKAYFGPCQTSGRRACFRGAVDRRPVDVQRTRQSSPWAVSGSRPESGEEGSAVSFLQKHLEDPAPAQRLKRWFYAGLAVVALIEIAVGLFAHEPTHFWFEDLPVWGSIYGLISCVLIIVVSKFLGHRCLLREEDYYDS